ncbi:MAG: ABC transporter permease subunit [Clostridiales bacterium]|nr:ABC transporter permease subunit [Clostridiales bacterium]
MTSTETKNAAKLKGAGTSKFMLLNRVAIIIACAATFYPGLNPGRVTSEISRYTSLLTASISYDSLVGNISRALKKGWVSESTFQLLMAASIILLVGVILCAVGGCMSAGNNRMRYVGIRFPLAGSVVMAGGLSGIYVCYTQIVAANTSKVPANFPTGFIVFAVLAAVILLTSLVEMKRIGTLKNQLEPKMEMQEKYHLFLLFLPILALAFVFSYLPLWGWRYAFFDYTAGSELTMDNFVGFKWFTYLFQNSATRSDILRVIKNTLALSGIGIVTSWLPMIFAIFLTQINSKGFRRVVQTCTTVPNFLGWVIVYAVALAIFSTDGFINSFLNNILGIASNTNYLMDSSHMWLKMWLWGTWKGLGWSSIIYISSITGIDPVLYEAATMDGAGRFAKIWNVTIPQLMPTFFVLLLMSIANVLSNGLDQYLVFSNASNMSSVEVLDLYVYNLGIGNGQIPLSTVVGMFKSVISVTLLFGANKVSKALRGESII